MGEVAGLWILRLLYGVDLSAYKIEFSVLLLSGGLNALVMFLTSVLTTMRYLKELLLFYAVDVLIGSVLAGILTKNGGIRGAVGLYFIVLLVLAICLGAFICRNAKSKCKDK